MPLERWIDFVEIKFWRSHGPKVQTNELPISNCFVVNMDPYIFLENHFVIIVLLGLRDIFKPFNFSLIFELFVLLRAQIALDIPVFIKIFDSLKSSRSQGVYLWFLWVTSNVGLCCCRCWREVYETSISKVGSLYKVKLRLIRLSKCSTIGF